MENVHAHPPALMRKAGFPTLSGGLFRDGVTYLGWVQSRLHEELKTPRFTLHQERICMSSSSLLAPLSTSIALLLLFALETNCNCAIMTQQ
jgi:hypothetical protein